MSLVPAHADSLALKPMHWTVHYQASADRPARTSKIGGGEALRFLTDKVIHQQQSKITANV